MVKKKPAQRRRFQISFFKIQNTDICIITWYRAIAIVVFFFSSFRRWNAFIRPFVLGMNANTFLKTFVLIMSPCLCFHVVKFTKNAL